MLSIGSKIIERYGIKLRLVEVSDAEFILNLRTNESLNKYLSPTNSDLESQINWLANYKDREKECREFYFVAFGELGKKIGTTRLYNFGDNCFEIGSWIFDKDSPMGFAIKADIITREIGFNDLGFDSCKFEVRKANTNVIRYHRGYKPDIIAEDEINYYFKLDKQRFNNYKDKIIKIL